MTNLNPHQEAAIESVKRLNDELREVKRVAREEARIIVEERVRVAQFNQDLAVKRAVELGASKRQVGERGLGTTSPSAVTDSLARVAGINV